MQVLENGKWLTVAIKPNGDKFYYYNNKLHREKGPAIELATGAKVWYYEGEKLNAHNQSDFDKFIKNAQATTSRFYDIKIEANLPATLTYRISATTPEEALEKARRAQPQSVKYRLQGKKDLKATVYEAGSSLIKLIQSLVGR